MARRFPGTVPGGELGFRFGEPLDVDGDGQADVAAGARFTKPGERQAGSAAVWSGASGARLRAWDGDPRQDGLFGHWVLPIPDLGSDGLADVIIAAPNTVVDGAIRGLVMARSPKTGEEIWRRAGPRSGSFGWDLALAGDHDGDGRTDVFVGHPGQDGGRAYLVGGRDGSILRTYAPKEAVTSFGWYVAAAADLDGDGRLDLVVGAPAGYHPGDGLAGGAFVFSSATGKTLHHWKAAEAVSGFGEVVAAVGDQDGDGRVEIVVASPAASDPSRARPGEVHVFSGATGKPLRHWSGRQAGELFGRMVVGAGDVDADGIEDVAIGAPWHRRRDGDKFGRVELRSGRSGALLHELVGDVAESWFGWHVRRAPDPEGRGRPALLIGSLRHPVDGKPRVGVLDLYVLRPDDQGIMKRGVRRRDIR